MFAIYVETHIGFQHFLLQWSFADERDVIILNLIKLDRSKKYKSFIVFFTDIVILTFWT